MEFTHSRLNAAQVSLTKSKLNLLFKEKKIMCYKNKLKFIFTFILLLTLTGCGGAKIYSSHPSKPNNGGSSGDDTVTPTFAQPIKIIDNSDISFADINWNTFLNSNFIAVTNDKHLIVSPIKTNSIQFINKEISPPENLTTMIPIYNMNKPFIIYKSLNKKFFQTCKYILDNTSIPNCPSQQEGTSYVNFAIRNDDIFATDSYGTLYQLNMDSTQNLNTFKIDTNTSENTLLTTDSTEQFLLALYKTNDSNYDLCATSIAKTSLFKKYVCTKNIFPNSFISKPFIFTNGKLVLQFSQQTSNDKSAHLLSISPYLIDDSNNKLNFISLSTKPMTYQNDIPASVNNAIIPFKSAFDENNSALYFVTTENNSAYLNAFHYSIVDNQINVISKKILLGTETSYSQPFLTTGNLKNPDKKIIIVSSSGILQQFSFIYDETQKEFVLTKNTFANVDYLDPIDKNKTEYKLDISDSMNFYTEMTSVETEKDGLQYLMTFSRDSHTTTPTNHIYKVDLNW